MSVFSQAVVAFEQGKFERAKELFTAAIDADEERALAHSKRGVCRLRCGDPSGAEQDFRAALCVDDRCLSAIVNLGNLMLERGMLDEAQQYYESALRIDETYAFAHYNLGVLHRRRGNFAASVQELRLAAKYEAKPEAARKRLTWWKRR